LALKVAKTDEVPSATTALAVFGGGGVQPTGNMVEPTSRDFLPTFKLPYGVEQLSFPLVGDDGQPVMAKGQPVMQSATGRIVVVTGSGDKKRIDPIPAPYIMTAYCIRGATRESIDAEGGGKSYVRTYANMATGGTNSELHTKQVARDGNGVDVGNVVLAVILTGKNFDAGVVGLMDCFRTLTDYFPGPLKSGLLLQGFGIRVDIDDHTVNTQKAKSGFQYYDKRKFTQWRQVQLTKEQLELASSTMLAKQAAVDAWLKREE
jgi:hypothetical protein